MRAAVVVFPGSNSDQEMIHSLREIMGFDTTVVAHTDRDIPSRTDLVAIPGGFTYGDYLRSGALARASAILPAIANHARQGGYVLGVCNGFQILTEVGLLPGALVRNSHRRFESREQCIRAENEGPFTSKPNDVLRVVIAHADGRYFAPHSVLDQLEGEGQVAFRYCDEKGVVNESTNPNGSLRSIAGIYGGSKKNILGLMPHPERRSETLVGSDDGRKVFEALLRN